jgi:basic membrane protein A and related proteins
MVRRKAMVRRTSGGTARLAVACAIMVVAAAGLVACGSDDDDPGGSGAQASESAAKDVKIGLAVDQPVNDKGFNEDAVDGMERVKRELGVETRVLVAKTAADHLPNLATLAQQGYDLVIATGFNYAEALNTVAARFPETKFAIIDFSQAALESKPDNVEGLMFAMEQSGYLAGYLAGSVETDTVSTVGGVRMPPVDQYIAGFRAGAKAANPQIKLLNGYSQTFTDPGACKQIAINQIDQGSDAIFQVASNCGLGVIDAAKQKGIWAVGGDIDQSFLGDHVLTSAMKRVDIAVFETAKSVVDGTYKGGRDVLFDVGNEGVGLGEINAEVPEPVVTEIEGVVDEMKAGEIAPPKSF